MHYTLTVSGHNNHTNHNNHNDHQIILKFARFDKVSEQLTRGEF